MEEIFTNLLSLDKDCREKASFHLEQIKANNPVEYCESLLNVLNSDTQENNKLVSIVLIRQSLPGLWDLFENDFKVLVKSKLLASIPLMNSWNLAKNLACTIAELAVRIIQSATGEKWPSILSSIITPLQGDNYYMKFISFFVLSEIIPYFCETFAKLKRKLVPIYIKHLQSPLPELRFVVINSLIVYISVINTSETDQYAETLKPLLSSVHYLCLEYPEYSQSCLKCLKELVESEPLYFKQDFLAVFSFFEELCRNAQVFVKVPLMEFIVVLIEKHRSSLLDKRSFLVLITESILNCLVDTAPGLMDGGEGSEQKCLVKLLRRLVSCIGESIVDFLLKYVEQGLATKKTNNEDFTVILVLGEISSYIYNTDKIEVILSGFNSFIDNQAAALRWVSFRVIEKLVKIPDKGFQDSLQGSVLGLLKGGLLDTDDLITKKVLKILLSVIQSVETIDLSKYFPEFMPLVLNSITKRNCAEVSLEILTGCCIKCKKLISGCYTQLLSFFLPLVREAEFWTQVKILDFLVSLRKIVTKTEYLANLTDILAVLRLVNQSSESCEGFKGLIVICKYLKKDFGPFLNMIIPELFQKLTGLDFSQEVGLELITALVDWTGEDFLEYSEKCLNYLINIVKTDVNDSEKLLACHITAKLSTHMVNSSRDLTPAEVLKFKQLLLEYWKWTEHELEAETLISLLSEIRILIDQVRDFSNEELAQYCSVILKLLQVQRQLFLSVDKKKSSFDSFIFKIFQVLFSHPTPPILICLQNILSSIHSKMHAQQFPEQDLLFIFILLQNTVLHCLQFMPLSQIESLFKTIDHFLKFPQYKIKKSCLKTLTLLHTNLSKDLFTKLAPALLAQLESVLVSVKDSKRLIDSKIKDLALIAIGQVIKYKFDCLSLELIIPWWASHLPINSHKSQARLIHDFLADLAVHLPFLNSNPQVVTILLTVAFTDLCAPYTLPKILKISESQNVLELEAGLSEKLRKMQVLN